MATVPDNKPDPKILRRHAVPPNDQNEWNNIITQASDALKRINAQSANLKAVPQLRSECHELGSWTHMNPPIFNPVDRTFHEDPNDDSWEAMDRGKEAAKKAGKEWDVFRKESRDKFLAMRTQIMNMDKERWPIEQDLEKWEGKVGNFSNSYENTLEEAVPGWTAARQSLKDAAPKDERRFDWQTSDEERREASRRYDAEENRRIFDRINRENGLYR